MWQPTSEADIVEGIRSGALSESHYVEVKEQARNEQIAQTLASFAIDGGMFIIGISEVKEGNGAKRLVPKPLAVEGMIERIDGISRNAIEPPLPVTTQVIQGGDGTGFVVITVPPSPLAPHMTGSKYYGRGDASKHALSDAEVLRHHQRRQEQANIGMKLLDNAESSDPILPNERKHGHIYLIAEPLMPVNATLVEQFLDDSDALRNFLVSGQNKCRPNLAGVYPTPQYATRIKRRELGVSMINSDADGATQVPHPADFSESSILDVELTESGGIRLLIGRGTDQGRTEEKFILDGLAVAYAQRLTFWTNVLSERYGYRSLWTLGLRINDVKGLRSHMTAIDDWGSFERPQTMHSDVYSRTITVRTDALESSPEGVVESLVGRLLKMLGTTQQHLGKVR
ncbi:AlbA family DNA-binding domain-containing protein [Pseudarthrobacter oxydans]|uniref:AlbA family DNA-binding domain-containing protein n=1 Tax=Pseudarthrobacter oxydans TaxID=1671 RepID=UPI00381389FD